MTTSEVQVERWLAWYKGGAVYTSDQMEWDELPQFGVLMMQLQLSNKTTVNLGSRDLYFRRENLIGKTDNAKDILRQFCPWVKFGDYTTDQEFREVAAKVQEEADRFRNS